MDTHPSSSDDLKELERRLSEWQPSTKGLSADSMLFAAGRNSVRSAGQSPRHLAWPIVSGCLALVVAALGIGLAQERAARLDLAGKLNDQRLAFDSVPPYGSETGENPSAEPLAASSYLASRWAIARDPDSWMVVAKGDRAVGPVPPSRQILKPFSPGDVLDP